MQALYKTNTWDRTPQKITSGLDDDTALATLISKGWRIEENPELLRLATTIPNPILDERSAATLQQLLEAHQPAIPIIKVGPSQELYPITEPDKNGQRRFEYYKTERRQYRFVNDENAEQHVQSILALINQERQDEAEGRRNPYVLQHEISLLTYGTKGRIVRDEAVVDLPPGDPQHLLELGRIYQAGWVESKQHSQSQAAKHLKN